MVSTLDRFDKEILGFLKENGRESHAEMWLCRQIGRQREPNMIFFIKKYMYKYD